jgi:hypothetical protein
MLSNHLLHNTESGDEDAEKIKCLTEQEIAQAVTNAAPSLIEILTKSVHKLRRQHEVDAVKLNAKFIEDGSGFTYKFADLDVYHAGLEGWIGKPDPNIRAAMKKEHCDCKWADVTFKWGVAKLTTPRHEFEYVVDKHTLVDGKRELGRADWSLRDFIARNGEKCVTVRDSAGIHGGKTGKLINTTVVSGSAFQPDVTFQVFMHESSATVDFLGAQLQWNDLVFRAKLLEEEVIAIRLYTGPMHEWYNQVLRFRDEPFTQKRFPFDMYKLEDSHGFKIAKIPFVTTLHVLNSAVLKISRTQPAQKVYRGSRGGVLPGTFWAPNDQNVRGGVELGFLSTTLNREVAMAFAKSENKPSLLFEIQMGMIDRGAAVRCFSQYPEEDEILFAPLTGLEVCGTPSTEGSTILVPLRLNANLHDLTIEQVVDKSKTSIQDFADFLLDEVKATRFSFDVRAAVPHFLKSFTNFRAEMDSRDGHWFNVHHNYRATVSKTLDMKEGEITKVHVISTLKTMQQPKVLARFHNQDAFKTLVNQLEGAEPTHFASSSFVRNYVSDQSTSKKPDAQYANYPLLWTTPANGMACILARIMARIMAHHPRRLTDPGSVKTIQSTC